MEKKLQELNRAPAAGRLGRPLLRLETVASTNDALKKQAEAGAPEGCAVVADEQTRGRGRQGRTWLSPKGLGLYLSVLFRPRWPAADTALLGLLAAAGVAAALEALGVREIGVKWPNDVLAHGKKIAGILVEPRISRRQIEFAVIGIGINVRQTRTDLAALGRGAATSCRLEGVRAERDRVLAKVLEELGRRYDPARPAPKDRILAEWARRQAGLLPGK